MYFPSFLCNFKDRRWKNFVFSTYRVFTCPPKGSHSLLRKKNAKTRTNMSFDISEKEIIDFAKYTLLIFPFLKRRWSSRTFQYDYLVTTSPPSRSVPSTAASLRLAYRLRVPPTRMVWRAVCTRPGNVFTASCWYAITSDSNFMESSFRLQSELR